MLYGQIKRAVLSRILRYTVAGAAVAASYNNQADHLNRIPGLINEGLVNILTLVKRTPAVWELTGGEPYGDHLRYGLPEDFYALKTGGVTVIRNGRLQPANDYRLQGRSYILIPADGEGRYSVEYYRYPRQLPEDPPDSFELEEDPEVVAAAVCYAAANLVMMEDSFAYAALYNDYESRLGHIMPGVTAEVGIVTDAYGFGREGEG